MNHRDRPATPARPSMPRPRHTALRFNTLALALLLLAGGVFDVQPRAFGQRGGLPNDLKTAANAGARQEEIEKFIKGQVTKLQKGTDAERQAARNLIGREIGMVGGEPSASYREVYATVLNEQLLTLTKNRDPHARLNAAIAMERVARGANNGALEGAAAALAQDPCAGVALWATKAAQSILPPLATKGANTKLTGAVVAGVKKHPDSPELAEEAYRALGLELRANLQRLNDQAVPVLLPDMLKLFEFRTGLYRTGIPPAPWLEERGAIFLTFARVWNHPAAAKYHAAIMQQLANLVGLTAQHAAARGPNENKSLIDLLRRIGAVLAVVGMSVKDAGVQAAAKSLSDMPAGLGEDALLGLAEKAYDAIEAKFPKTKPAPIIEEGAADEEEEPVRPTAAPDGDGASAGASDETEEADEDVAGADSEAEARPAAERTPGPARGKSDARQ